MSVVLCTLFANLVIAISVKDVEKEKRWI